ncbi:MAG: MMPL family transporter [Rhodoluna sp.]|nr:MMPL family transporter [Rhodoluna sp.]MBP6187007.1 MMPL family transporter [Rhodoluna sp.]
MAELLYRIGQFSGRRAWLVIVTWVLILVATVSAMVLSGGKLATTLSISGTPSQQIIDDLRDKFPDASRGTAQVVFYNESGARFSAAQVAEITEALNGVAQIENVNSVVDPFVTDAERASQLQELNDGAAKLADAEVEIASQEEKLTTAPAQIAAGRKTISEKLATLTTGETQVRAGLKTIDGQLVQVQAGLDALVAAQAPADQLTALESSKSQLVSAKAGLVAQLAQIDAGKIALANATANIDAQEAQIASGKIALEDGKTLLAENSLQVNAGQRLVAAAEKFRTVSADGATALATIVFTKQIDLIEPAQREEIIEFISSKAPAGVQVEFSQALTNSAEGILGVGELIGLFIAAIVLLLMLRTFTAAGLPLLAAVLGVGISATLTMALAAVVPMTSTTPILGVMLGLAVGIDYALFILNRHRRQLKAGMPMLESIGLANGTSGNAVFFAGLTVIIALAALNLTGIEFLGMMGTMGAVAIFVSVLIAVTFTPAISALIGERMLSKKERLALAGLASQPKVEEPEVSDKRRIFWPVAHPFISLFLVVATLSIAALPLASMRLGLPDGSSESTESTQYRAFKLTSAGFGEGANGQVIAVATIEKPESEAELLEVQADIAERIMSVSDVAAVVPAAVSEDETRILFQIQPVEGPASASTEELVFALRELAPEFKNNFGAALGITGLTASNIDVSQKLSDALPLYLGTVLLLSMFILVLVFRSIAVPIIASLGFLLTVVATLGVVVATYQWGWLGGLLGVHDPGPILSFLPTIVIGIVFGLAMDYQLFLVSGMREAYVHGESPKQAILSGIRSGRSVVVAAAIIMIMVFGGFASSELASVRPMGLALAAGVLIDAFLIRLVFVPALMSLMGKSAWWIPRWLDRALPQMDVEGAKLEARHKVGA